MESKQRRSRKHSSFDDGSERASEGGREAEREEGRRRRRARKERSGQRLSPSTAIADGMSERERESRLEREEERPWNLLFAVASSVRQQSVRQSMRAVKRASASVKGIGHVLRSPPKPKGARRRESGQRRARHSDSTGRTHAGTEGERHMGRSSNTCQDREQARSTSPGPQVRGARQWMMEGRPRPRKA